jgi:hypothetical protein
MTHFKSFPLFPEGSICLNQFDVRAFLLRQAVEKWPLQIHSEDEQNLISGKKRKKAERERKIEYTELNAKNWNYGAPHEPVDGLREIRTFSKGMVKG